MNITADPSLVSTAIAVIHKYIRTEIFALSDRLACADHSAAGELQKAFGEMAVLLRGHSANEDTAFETLLRDYDPLLANTLEDDHLRLDAHLTRILASADALSGLPAEQEAQALYQLHLDWNQFVGEYLLHLDDEERRLFPAIKQYLPPISVLADTINLRPEPRRQTFVSTLKKITTPDEQASILDAVENV